MVKTKKIRIKQLRSAINRPKRQKDTLQALGLKRIGSCVEKEASAPIEGMIRKVHHLVEVQKIS
ncbi:MAG: 50S ribosomal protein L30 [Cytophagales bacterium]|nr:50S ribosomal protein L30 [Cytophagales bacterium]